MYHPETCHIGFCSSPFPALSCPQATPSHRPIPMLLAKQNSAAGSQLVFFPNYFLGKREMLCSMALCTAIPYKRLYPNGQGQGEKILRRVYSFHPGDTPCVTICPYPSPAGASALS